MVVAGVGHFTSHNHLFYRIIFILFNCGTPKNSPSACALSPTVTYKRQNECLVLSAKRVTAKSRWRLHSTKPKLDRSASFTAIHNDLGSQPLPPTSPQLSINHKIACVLALMHPAFTREMPSSQSMFNLTREMMRNVYQNTGINYRSIGWHI